MIPRQRFFIPLALCAVGALLCFALNKSGISPQSNDEPSSGQWTQTPVVPLTSVVASPLDSSANAFAAPNEWITVDPLEIADLWVLYGSRFNSVHHPDPTIDWVDPFTGAKLKENHVGAIDFGNATEPRMANSGASLPVRPAGANGRVTQSEVTAFRNGFVQAVSAIEERLANEVFKETFPLMGTNYFLAWSNNVPAFRYLTTLRNAVVTGLDSLSGEPDYAPTNVAGVINTRLTSAGFNAGTVATVSTDNNTLQVAFVTVDSFAATNIPVSTNFGLPNLDLRLGAAANAAVTATVMFNFSAGVDESGFYFETGGAAFQFNTTNTVAAINAPVWFTRLPYQATDVSTNRTSVPLQIAITLKDPNNDGVLRLGELTPGADLLDAALTGNTRLSLRLLSSLASSAMLPQVGTDLSLVWNFAGSLVNPNDDNAEFGGQPVLNLNFNRINLHSFFNSFASRALDQIDDVTEPLVPVIEILTTEIPLLSDLGSDTVTLLDVLGVPESTVAAIEGLTALANLATQAGGFTGNQNTFVDLGGYAVAGDLRTTPLEELPGGVTRQVSSTRPSNLNTFRNNAQKIAGLQFPLLEDASVIANLLLGRNATLFNYESGDIAFNESFRQFFPVLGPVGVTFGGRIGFSSQFGFGYDTQGILDFYSAGGANPDLLFNGFYALALDAMGEPATGMTLEASVTAGIEANIGIASAGVEGDLTATVGIYLDDLIADEFGRVRGNVFASLPIDEWFYAAGALSAGLHAYLEVGWPPLGVSFDFYSPRVTLISFDSRDEEIPVLASWHSTIPGRLMLNVGDRAPLRLHGDLDDRAEEYEISLDGSELLISAFNKENSFPTPNSIVGQANLRGDILSMAADVAVPVEFSGGPGRDILRGGSANDVLVGGDGPDRLEGRGGNDLLQGGLDNDELRGGSGNNTLDGGEGLDTASWVDAAIPVVIDLRTGTLEGAAIGDTLISIERYRGTPHDDAIDGSEGLDSLLAGWSGNDTIRGHGGDDLLEGGSGDDVLEGGSGSDMLEGGLGADQLDGGPGMDTASYLGAQSPVAVSLKTGAGTGGDALGDLIVGVEILVGSGLPKERGSVFASGDTLEGSDNADTIFGMDGADTIRGEGGDDILYGNHPDAVGSLIPGYDADKIFGGAGNDVLHGHADDDEMDGEEGSDTLYGGLGNDHLTTFDLVSADHLDGGEGTNRLSADYSDKTIPIVFLVGTNNSMVFPDGDQYQNMQTLGTLQTGSSNDVIRLSSSLEYMRWSKTIDAGAGDDLVVADSREFYPGVLLRTFDALGGGDGIDTISFEQSQGAVTVNLSSGGLGGAATGMTMSGFENVIGSYFSDNLTGDTNDNIFTPLVNPAWSPGNGNQDYVQGGGGHDVLRIDFSNVAAVNAQGISMTPNYTSGFEGIAIGSQWDVLGSQMLVYYISIKRFEITGGDGPDRIYGEGIATSGTTNFNDTFLGMGGNDYIEARMGDDFVDGGEGNDNLLAGSGNDTIHGGHGNDNISFSYSGGYGFDLADAGSGNDTISNLRDMTPSSVPNPNAEAGAVFRADGGTGYDVLNADYSNQPDPIHFNQANPTDLEFANGAYIRGIEHLRYFVTGSGDDTIFCTGREENRLHMMGGNDIVNPGLGIDIVCGGAGDDLLIVDYSVGDVVDLSGVVSTSADVHFRTNLLTGAVVDRVTVSLGGASINVMERSHFTGTAKSDIIRGREGSDTLLGANGNDSLFGNGGNDWLDGGVGADSMNGGSGNDTFVVDDPGDVVTDTSGSETVRAAINYSLPGNIENLVLTGETLEGVGNGSANQLTGNAHDNFLRGEGGNDTLNGGGGAAELDRLNGGLGADTFVLGEGSRRFYDDHQPNSAGHGGYAILEDFTPSQNDRLRLSGEASDYVLGPSPIAAVPGTALYHDENGNGFLDSETDELIAILVSPEALTAANVLNSAIYTQGVDFAVIGLTSPVKPIIVADGSGARFAVEFSIFEPAPTNILIEVQTSDDLGVADPWFTIASKAGTGSWTGLSGAWVGAVENGRVSVRIPAMEKIDRVPRLFFRIKLSNL